MKINCYNITLIKNASRYADLKYAYQHKNTKTSEMCKHNNP